jgi:hypothetical protein
MTNTITLSYEDALQGLKDAVAKKGPDFQYKKPGDFNTQCMNFLGGQPSCIAGHVYYGVDPAWARDFELIYAPVETLVDGGELEVDAKTKVLLQIAQNKQDFGMRWGPAVELAQKVAERFGHLL